MAEKKELKENDIEYLLENSDFSQTIKQSANTVIVVMTQSWCPQWVFMKTWLYSLKVDDLDIYELVYNKHNRFEAILSLKENSFGNYPIPYLRIYQKGELVNEYNNISKRRLYSVLKKLKK